MLLRIGQTRINPERICVIEPGKREGQVEWLARMSNNQLVSLTYDHVLWLEEVTAGPMGSYVPDADWRVYRPDWRATTTGYRDDGVVTESSTRDPLRELRDLALTERTLTVLRGHGIMRVMDVTEKSPAQLLALRGVGMTTVLEVLGELDAKGYALSLAQSAFRKGEYAT